MRVELFRDRERPAHIGDQRLVPRADHGFIHELQVEIERKIDDPGAFSGFAREYHVEILQVPVVTEHLGV